MLRRGRAAAIAAVLCMGGAAGAHELTCDKRVNGAQVAVVREFPTTVEFTYRVNNVHPSATSELVRAEDPILVDYGFVFTPGTPLALPVGASAEARLRVYLQQPSDCFMYSILDGIDDGAFDSTFRVTWPLGETQCAARLICDPEPPECAPEDCPVFAPRRTGDEGFFKTHEEPLQACLAAGPVELGALGTVETVEQGLGLLWGSPELHADGAPRTPGEALRFDVGRQLLVAACNSRLYGAQPPRAALLTEARGALSGPDCQGLRAVLSPLKAFNASGVGQPQPEGQRAGPSTPVHAKSLARDFTRPSGFDCDAGVR
ncbi:hypothetical protein P2318_01550 [Myxococcaceae bacterium GXIMD 01537]